MDINICGIYLFRRIKDNSLVYVGQTSDINNSKYITSSIVLLDRLKRNGKEWFWNYYKKEYIETFTYDKYKLNELETYYINLYKTHTSFNNKGYNYNFGGDGNKGYRFTQEQKEHISINVKLNRLLNPLSKEQHVNYSEAVKKQHINPSPARLLGRIRAGKKLKGKRFIIKKNSPLSNEDKDLIINLYKTNNSYNIFKITGIPKYKIRNTLLEFYNVDDLRDICRHK